MLSDITAVITTIKTATDFVALVLNTKVNSAVREKAIELQANIISLQSSLLSLRAQYEEVLEEKDRLKQQLMQMKNWETEAGKYSLKEIATGVFVYAINENKQGTQPVHWLCANCYESQQKSILQRGKLTYDGLVYFCGNCKVEIFDHNKRRPYPNPATSHSF